MTTANASPRPWRVETWNSFPKVTDDNGELVAPIATTREADDNAALIVRAVNAHEAMRDALRDALEMLEAQGITSGDVHDRITAALAAAGEDA